MAVRAGMTSNRRHVQRAMQAVGFVALLTLAVGAVLTASGAFAGGLAASSVKPAYAPILDDTDTPTSTPNPCDPVWSVVSIPNVVISSALQDVAVVTANDVWAVGYYYVDQGPYSTLIEHWDGTSWSAVSSPNVGTGSNQLYGVAAVSANDVWAVGPSGNSTLTEHWDGTSWSVVPSPNLGQYNHLHGVAAVSATDVWAVGYYCNTCPPYNTLVEHWDGTSWSVVPSPNVGASYDYLWGVAAVSANNVWAAGSSGNSTLTEHWDGTSWSVVPSPNPGASGNSFNGITAVSANDVWAVGSYRYNSSSTTQTLTEHWDGTSWSVVSSPSPCCDTNILNGIAAASPNDVWAMGRRGDSTLTEHWDGTSWSVVSSPSPGSNNYLWGIEAASSNDVWAVGYYQNTVLVEHYASQCGTPINTPTPSATVIINGHLTWQGVSPTNRPSVPGTLTLCGNSPPQTINFTTDTGGYFTITTVLPDGTYHWGTRGSRHLSNSSPADGAELVVTNGYATQEFGTQRGGNANTDNIVNANDFNIFKNEFGMAGIRRSDFDYNTVVNILDYNIQKGNFGQAGHLLTCR